MAKEATKLPLFRLVPPDDKELSDAGALEARSRLIFATSLQSVWNISSKSDRVAARSGSQVVELFRASGAVWARNASRLWRRPGTGAARVDPRAAMEFARAFPFERVLPSILRDQPVEISDASRASALCVVYERVSGVWRRSEPVETEIHVTRRIRVKVETEEPDVPPSYEVVGGGGKLRLVLGPKNVVHAFQGSWRAIAPDRERDWRDVIPWDEDRARDLLAAQLRSEGGWGGGVVTSMRSRLAYLSGPRGERQDVLFPVRLVDAEIGRDAEGEVALATTIVPATDYVPPASGGPADESADGSPCSGWLRVLWNWLTRRSSRTSGAWWHCPPFMGGGPCCRSSYQSLRDGLA